MITMKADICLVLEGTYPYVQGGVSQWTHELISRMEDYSFHLCTILSPDAEKDYRYDLPSNVLSVTDIELQRSKGTGGLNNLSALLEELEAPLVSLTQGNGGLDSFARLLEILRPYRGSLTLAELMDSRAAWELVQRMYMREYEESSFLDYFWSWRALMGSLFTIALADLPRAGVYHTLATGYAGLVAARAKLEYDKPTIITEHGIYTNERRIEIASADWLEQTAFKKLTIDHVRNSLRDFWVNSFANFSRTCYEASDEIVTLFQGNQPMQINDGAEPEKMRIIPNGVDVDNYAAVSPEPHDRPTIALIGRVVPIKDIKSFIRSVGIMAEQIPDINVFIMGPTDEDISYYQECRQMVEYMGLSNNITFTGQVNISRYLPQIDICVLSSISEAMPLVILEAGACGIPTVATDVGACRDIIYGMPEEEPAIGEGGAIVPLANPTAIAENVVDMLRDRDRYLACSNNIRERVRRYFNKADQIQRYRELYDGYLHQDQQAAAAQQRVEATQPPATAAPTQQTTSQTQEVN
jgi:glycosyltransferase involved in cell wall biosynthesis